MTEDKNASDKIRKASTKPGILARLRTYFFTGLVVFTPIAATFYMASSMINLVDETIKPWIPSAYNPDTYLPFSLPGFGLILLAIFFVLLGMITARAFGRTLLRYGERLVDNMPVIRTVYSALKILLKPYLTTATKTLKKLD